jgi:hypothetical protein
MFSTGLEKGKKRETLREEFEILILHPTFFAPIIQYVALASDEPVVFEMWDNFQKQTYRNRCYICGANGKQLLSVPVVHAHGKGRQKTRDVRIDNSFRWQVNMLRSLEASYRSSPFFEFYEDDIRPIFEKKQDFLLDLNLASIEVVNECLGLDTEYLFTEKYQMDGHENDFRYLVNAKSRQVFEMDSYTQVFESKHGFLGNLSVLDLLFNEGTNALHYLEKHQPVLDLK